jgi:glycosyltransferase involved in cell wall biosynthesis
MRILIVNCVFTPEPVVSAQIGRELAEILGGEGHTVSVIAPFPSRPFQFKFNEYSKSQINVEKIAHNITICRIPSFTYPESNILGRLWESISFGWHSYRFILNNANDIDCVYMNTWPLFAQYAVAKACKKVKLPYTSHIQDIYPESLVNKLPRLLNKIAYFLLFPFEKYITKHAHRLIVISKKMHEYIINTRKVAPLKTKLVYNWQDEKEFESYANLWPTEKLTFMYLGNIGPVAGLVNVINAFVKADINAKLILAGNGSKRQECEAIANENPTADIEFLNVPLGDVPKVQARAHVLLLPMIKGAASSSIPSKLPAYLFSARPILALLDENSDSWNAINEANCGWTGVSQDEAWLTQQFKTISSLPQEELKSLGKNGLVYGIANFSKKINLNKLKSTIIYG